MPFARPEWGDLSRKWTAQGMLPMLRVGRPLPLQPHPWGGGSGGDDMSTLSGSSNALQQFLLALTRGAASNPGQQFPGVIKIGGDLTDAEKRKIDKNESYNRTLFAGIFLHVRMPVARLSHLNGFGMRLRRVGCQLFPGPKWMQASLCASRGIPRVFVTPTLARPRTTTWTICLRNTPTLTQIRASRRGVMRITPSPRDGSAGGIIRVV